MSELAAGAGAGAGAGVVRCPGCGHTIGAHGEGGCRQGWIYDREGVAARAGCPCAWRPSTLDPSSDGWDGDGDGGDEMTVRARGTTGRKRKGLSKEAAADLSLALDTIAREALARCAEEVQWEDYPDIGENDWHRVIFRAKSLAPRQDPRAVRQAYALLEERADSQEGE